MLDRTITKAVTASEDLRQNLDDHGLRWGDNILRLSERLIGVWHQPVLQHRFHDLLHQMEVDFIVLQVPSRNEDQEFPQETSTGFTSEQDVAPD